MALLDLGALTTVRRRITRLIEAGCIATTIHQNDRRVTGFVVAPALWERFEKLRAALDCVAYELVTNEVGMTAKADTTIHCDAKTCSAAARFLKERIGRYGKPSNIRLSCSRGPNVAIFAMIDLNGDAHGAAADLSGAVFGGDMVCAYLRVPESFSCDKVAEGVTCLGIND